MPLAAPPQPRQSTAASRQALIAQRLAAQEPNVAQAYQESLENTTHYRSLEKKSLSRHKHISNLWKEFVEQHAEAANMSAVITRGCKLPTEGGCTIYLIVSRQIDPASRPDEGVHTLHGYVHPRTINGIHEQEYYAQLPSHLLLPVATVRLPKVTSGRPFAGHGLF